MNIFSEKDFNDPSINYLRFSDEFEIDDRNKIIFGYNGIGKSSIYNYLKNAHKDEYEFMDYNPDSNSSISSSSNNTIRISANTTTITRLEGTIEDFEKNKSVKALVKSRLGIKSKASAKDSKNDQIIEAYNHLEAFAIAEPAKNDLDVLHKYIEGDEAKQLLDSVDAIRQIESAKEQVKNYSQDYMLKVFDDLDGHYDETTTECPVCGAKDIHLLQIITDKKKSIAANQKSIFHSFRNIKKLNDSDQEEAIEKVISSVSSMTGPQLFTACIGQFDKEIIKQIDNDYKEFENNSNELSELKEAKKRLYNQMSQSKEFTKNEFEKLYPGTSINFDDKNETVIIKLNRKYDTYSTGEKDEMQVIITTLSFAGSGKKILILDDPLSSYDLTNQYRIVYRIAKLCEKKEKNVIAFTHDINMINIMNSQRSGIFDYYYIEKANSILSLQKIKSEKDSVLSMHYLEQYSNKWIELLIHRDKKDSADYIGNKLLHYDEPFRYDPDYNETEELEFSGMCNDDLTDMIDRVRTDSRIMGNDSFESNTIMKIVYMLAARVWIEKEFYQYLKSKANAEKQKKYRKTVTLSDKYNLCKETDGFDQYFPKLYREQFMMKKVMLNQNAHYNSQIVPFYFAMNISIDDLNDEILDIKECFQHE